MAAPSQTTFELRFAPLAFERLFLVADVLAEHFASPGVEYAMLGLADRSDPFFILQTPLLRDQDVTASSVRGSGYGVLRMRSEIQLLSRRRQRQLIPTLFVHRHPGSCQPSHVDHEFVSRVFVNQVSTILTFSGEEETDHASAEGGSEPEKATAAPPQQHIDGKSTTVEYAVCFSMIVNQEREYSIVAARKEWPRGRGGGRVRCFPAAVRRVPDRPLRREEIRRLRGALELEIEDKVRLPKPASGGAS